MSQSEIANLPQPLVMDESEDFRVAVSAYTDPLVFDAEMEWLFEHNFVYVAHESELKHPGDYKTTWIGRRPVIVARDREGELHVHLNACRHRGNAICREGAGNTSSFRCPYHGWTYGLDGNLKGVPDKKSFPQPFLQALPGLVGASEVGHYRGLVFARLGGGMGSFEDFLEPIRDYIDLWADRSIGAEYSVRLPHRYTYQGNWKFQMDNSLDGYHGPYVHESGFGALAYSPSDPEIESVIVEKSKRNVSEGRFLGLANSNSAISCTKGLKNGCGLTEVEHRLGSGFVGVTLLTADSYARYTSALKMQYGQARAERIVAGRHLLIFPNLILMDVNIRVVHPLSVESTYVESYYIRACGVDDTINDERLRDLQARLGTAGFVGPDDQEMFAANQTGMQAGLDFIFFNKGIEREIDVGTERKGGPSDEVPQRAFYRQWAQIMEHRDG